MGRGILLFLLSLLPAAGASAQNGVSLLAHLDPRHGGPGPFYGFYYASCWGYVAPDGHEYALLGTYSGTVIVDIDANPIREVAYIPGANSEWKELKTWGPYAYVVSEGNQGLQIINLSQLPDTAWLVRSISTAGPRNISRNHTITVADGYLYINGSSAAGQVGGTIILSLADPENPAYVGEYQPDYLHDVYVRKDTLYGAGIYGSGVWIASLASKSAPQTIGRIQYAGAGTHNTWVSPDGRFLYTTDEIGQTDKNMKVFELTGYTPSFTYTTRTPFTANPVSVIHNVHGRGGYVYIAHYDAGVYVADVRTPLNITNAGGYDTYTGFESGYLGSWGVYPYFPSGRWIASDTQTGLYLFSFAGLAPRTRAPLLQPENGDTVEAGAPISFRWRAAADQSADPHVYDLRLRGPGLDTVITTADTALTAGPFTGMQEGETYAWSLVIRDEFTRVAGADTFALVAQGIGTVVEENAAPAAFALSANYPNPFNPTTHFNLVLAAPARVGVTLLDVLGRDVRRDAERTLPAGASSLTVDAGGLPSAVYVCRITAVPLGGGPAVVAVRRVVLTK